MEKNTEIETEKSAEIPKNAENEIKIEVDEIKQKNSEENKELNPYSYLERDFCSENFKIELNNLPKYYGFKELKKLINVTLKLNSAKIKAVGRNSGFIFICFHSEDEREEAIKKLNDYSWKKSTLKAFKSKPSQDPYLKKRKQDDETDTGKRKSVKLGIDDLKEKTCKYWNIPYTEQLQKKEEELKGILKKVASNLKALNSPMKDYILKQQNLNSGLPCQLLPTLRAEKIDNYRNKCEFTVGIHYETGEKTVGFRLGTYAEGSVSVGDIQDLPHIPEAMKVAVKVFEKFVRKSQLSVYNPVDQSGEFRQLTARIAGENQLMLIVGISPRDIDEGKVEELQKQLAEYFFDEEEGKEAKVTSLYYEPLVKKKSDNDVSGKPVFLRGDMYIYETILDLKFRISAESFFQINTQCAEVLFKAAMDLAELKSTTTLIDVFCGTGTIGLCCAKNCDQVLGLDIVPEAIEDARKNAADNRIENCEFFCGKAEEILYSVATRARNEDTVAITDPPRAGIRREALLALRKVEKIKKIVFIACNIKSSAANFVDLARPESKTVQGVPFVPTKAVIVDMFPHTQHFELIVLLERLNVVNK